MTDHQIEKLIDQAAKATKPIARVVRLDSAMATELLARAATNRDVRRTRVARYRADMEGGHWVLNGEPMIISSEGKLIDGQHRCLAIQGTEAAVDVLLVLGVHPLAMATMGQGVPRTAGDYLGIEGEPNARTCANIARLMLAYRRNEGEALRDTAKPTNAEVLEFYHEHRDVIQKSAALALQFKETVQTLVAPGVLGFCHAVLEEIDEPAAEEFITKVAKGELLEETDPAYVVRARLLNMGKSGAAKKASVIFSGWNAFRSGRSLKSIRVSTRLPLLAGAPPNGNA